MENRKSKMETGCWKLENGKWRQPSSKVGNAVNTAMAAKPVGDTGIETVVGSMKRRKVPALNSSFPVPNFYFQVSIFHFPVSIFQFPFSGFFFPIMRCPQS
jgi:hypothetical protein